MGTDNLKIHEAFGDIVSLIVNTETAKDAVESAVSYTHLDVYKRQVICINIKIVSRSTN